MYFQSRKAITSMNLSQEGIYYDKAVPESFGILFLQVKKDASSNDVGMQLYNLWKIYEDLKRGIVEGVPEVSKNTHTGNLSVLIGYNTDIFDLRGIKQARPQNFPARSVFFPPNSGGGGPIFEGSNLTYDKNVIHNHAAEDQIVIQFIADTEFAVNRAILTTWETLTRMTRISNERILWPTRFYGGHNRPDKRNWLGFLDGISNMKSEERKDAIYIAQNQVDNNTKWTVDGTYLAFMRIIIDAISWWEIVLSEQEIMVGREKSSGCPLIGVDIDGKPLKDRGCPAPGTTEITDPGNERFREHPEYGKQATLSSRATDSILRYSHTASVRKAVNIPARNIGSFRIYRQGFEFLEQGDHDMGFKVGLNFVSFQNNPQRIVGTLTNSFASINQYFSIHAAGLFFVPPVNKNEGFPGSNIFLNEIQDLEKTKAGLYKV